ncbi:phosphoglycerate kinase [bacterium]|nr:phosphoglycerate kinase [bacterium]
MKFLSEAKREDLKGKTVLLRIDSDVDLRKEGGKLVVDEDFRLRCSLPTIHFLRKNQVKKIILLGHLGRPEGKRVASLSLEPVANWFAQQLSSCPLFSLGETTPPDKLVMMENLRFWEGEEDNSPDFAQQLGKMGDVFVNDAFGVCHRAHASIVSLPKVLPSFLGIRVEGEVKALSWLKENAPAPLVFVIGGSKPGKVDYLPFLSEWADWLLVGGRLPALVKERKMKLAEDKVVLGKTNTEGKDINEKTIAKFKEVISLAKTIIWAGPMGVYEEKTNRKGTWEVARAIVANRGAFKVAGGGDTHRVLSWAGLWGEFNFVSVGGGAMLQFLRDGSLPGLQLTVK